MLGSKPTQRYCRYCGSSVIPTDAFCSSCGERLAPREGVARDERGAQPPSRAGTRHVSFSRFWPASASRMPQHNHLILILVFGFLAAAYIHPVVGLLTILIGALLAWAIRKRNPPSATAAALSQRLASVRFM